MVDKKSIINSVIFTIKLASEPALGFLEYQKGKMYDYYDNFLDFILTKLFDDRCIEEHIKEGVFKDWGIKHITISKIKGFSDHLYNFYKTHEESDDFTLIRDNYWDEFSKEAKECVELLERDLKNIE